ncbi:helix-turn-helix domain-containing protein [Halosegnis sp.]|uniref:helix-turn-helix domain-containing protein n=1 Tax=Halosegnis sp. TaxID=2864959 RepID=UPI0035D3DB49
MTSGFRAELRIREPPSCQVAAATESAGDAAAVTWGGDGATVTEEVTLPSDADPDGMEEVFSDGDRSVYRFDRPADQACVCEVIEQHGAPIRDVRGEDGRLHVTFHVEDVATLRELVGQLRETTGGVSLERLTQSATAGGDRNLVLVDRAALTDRQREVLETAHELGYFARPKGANATEVADALGISRSTFAEHLAAAQSKLLDAVLDGDG